MFNDGFYPSTPEVIELMVAPLVHEWKNGAKRYLKNIERILEPSAGKGDIADYLTKHFEVNQKNIYCCEIDPELAMILRGKDYTLIEMDFLRLADPYQYDLIIMNPPFSDADSHILHAWELLKMFGGQIIAQVNVETIDNPYTFEREKLARIIDKSGTVERIGQPYRNAQRSSNVEVAIVRLTRQPDGTPLDFGNASSYDQDRDEKSGQYERNELTSASRLSAIVASYEAARKVIIDKSDLDGKFYFYTKGIADKPVGTVEDIIENQKNADRSELNNRANQLNKDLSALKAKFWKYLFDRTEIAEVATSKVQADFEKFIAESQRLSFNVQNIQQIFMQIRLHIDQIREDCITQTFDKLCSYDGENVEHHEGWVTNDSYRVNRKVIVPIRAADYDGDWKTWWDTPSQVIANDIDKAMCFVTGKEFLKITTIRDAILDVTQNTRGRNRRADAWDGFGPAPAIYSEFFKIRIFKKGTIHLTFLNEDDWMRFNVEAAKGKKWIGAETVHKSTKTRAAHRRRAQREYDAIYSN